MINLAEGESNQILLLAPKLLGESLSTQLNNQEPDLKIFLRKEDLTRNPCLVIWSIERLEIASVVQIELRRLQEYWMPAPVLLLLPEKVNLKTSEVLQFDCPGLLQDPDINTLREAIGTIRGGGRVVRLKDQEEDKRFREQSTMGLGQWLLLSGIQQINGELQKVEQHLNPPPQNSFKQILLYGRRRELKASKMILYWLWGPLRVAIDPLESNKDTPFTLKSSIGSSGYPLGNEYGTNINLKKRDSISVWEAIHDRLDKTIQEGLVNSTGNLLAIEGLSVSRQKDLLIALLNQLDQVIKKLRNQKDISSTYKESWLELQPELLKEALRSMAGSYVRLPFKNQLTPVGEQVLTMSNLSESDEELPECEQMLNPLLTNTPLTIEGQLLPADDPRAVIQLEMFISNWLIRSAELVSSEVISASGQWPELRRYLLKPKFISTRELERLRNQLNSQNRWKQLIQRPIQLYESKRLFYRLRKGHIQPVLVTEPRDEELRQLDWWQQQVALLVEARDAIAPQIQLLITKVGDLMVIILTQVIGRAIGLVGRGIAQGMGRSLGRN